MSKFDGYDFAKYAKRYKDDSDEWIDREHPILNGFLGIFSLALPLADALYITSAINGMNKLKFNPLLAVLIFTLAVILTAIDYIITLTPDFIMKYGLLNIISSITVALFIYGVVTAITYQSVIWIMNRVTDGRFILALCGLVILFVFLDHITIGFIKDKEE